MNYQYELIKTDHHVPAMILIQNLTHEQRIVPRHWHRSLEIDLVVEGAMSVTLDGKPYVIDTNDIFFVNSGSLHSVAPHHTACIKTITLLIAYDFTKQVYPLFDTWSFDIHHDQFPLEQLKQYLYQLKAAYLSDEDTKILTLNLLLHQILHLVITQAKKIPRNTLYLEHEVDYRIKYALSMIKEHYQQAQLIDKILQHLQLTQAYFSRLFKKETGLTFNTMLINYRLQQAYRELITSQHPIIDIALNNGFPSTDSFIKHFKAKYHVPPQHYRKLINETETS